MKHKKTRRANIKAYLVKGPRPGGVGYGAGGILWRLSLGGGQDLANVGVKEVVKQAVGRHHQRVAGAHGKRLDGPFVRVIAAALQGEGGWVFAEQDKKIVPSLGHRVSIFIPAMRPVRTRPSW